MAKKVFKGWCANESSIDSMFKWYGYEDSDSLLLENEIMRSKGSANEWASWPPKRVTVTVEVED